MSTRFHWRRWFGIAAIPLILGAGIWMFFAHRSTPEEKKEAEAEPRAQVQVAPLRRGKIERTVIAYGTTATAPGGVRSVSYPFESRVVTVQASLGQTVAAGDTLLQIEQSADALLALESARSGQQAAEKALRDTQSRFKARLATNADLAAAESAARDAQLKLDSLQSRMPDPAGLVKAPAAGVVTKLPAGPGTVVASGGPLTEIAVGKSFEARLGIAPVNAGEVKPGQEVHLSPVEARGGSTGEPAALRGTVRVIGASIDPATRLVDAFVTLDDPGTPVLIGSYLRAGIVVETKEALLAPRAAVQPEEEGSGGAVFTVKDEKAVKHAVETGLDDGENVEIMSTDQALHEGTEVVMVGAHELEDKMAVEIAKEGEKADGKKDDDEKADGKKDDKKAESKKGEDKKDDAKGDDDEKADGKKNDAKKDDAEDKTP